MDFQLCLDWWEEEENDRGWDCDDRYIYHVERRPGAVGTPTTFYKFTGKTRYNRQIKKAISRKGMTEDGLLIFYEFTGRDEEGERVGFALTLMGDPWWLVMDGDRRGDECRFTIGEITCD